MWLASLRRLIAGKSSSQRKHSRPQRRRFIPTLDYLEERIALSTFNVNAGDTAGLIAAINQANTDGSGDTINLTNSTYTITGVNNTTNGANALPPITATSLTIVGNGSTINGASLGRLFDVASLPGSVAGLTLENLTLTKGLATGTTAQGGAIYNSGGNITLKTVVVGGNEASGGAGASGQGGGIYSNGGTLSLSNDIIGAQVTKYYNSSGQLTKQTTIGAGNLVIGSGGGNVQGGGIYANGATLTVSGGSVSNNVLLGGGGGSGAAGTANKPNGGAGGAGGSAQGGGIYLQGGSFTLTNGTIVQVNETEAGVGGAGGAGNNAGSIYGVGGVGGAGGNSEGGGVYASNATVAVENGALVNNNSLDAGGGGTGGRGGQGKTAGQGGTGGAALGGGLFVKGGSVTIASGAQIDASGVNAGLGGNGGGGTSAAANPAGMIGGAGGVGGAAEGGGVYVVSAPLTLTSGAVIPGTRTATAGINANTLFAGRGGNGGYGGAGAAGGNGGAGGQSQGGGVFASGSNLAVALGNASQTATIALNGGYGGGGGSAGAGQGGAANGVGGAGGIAIGGGAVVVGDKLTATNANISFNVMNGGNGGVGVVSSKGYVISNFGAGGDSQGGGLFVSGSSDATVLNSTLQSDGNVAGIGDASGGNAAGNAKYGLGGSVQGGGLYAAASTVNVLNSTFAENVLAAGTQVGTSKSVGGHSSGGGAAQGGGMFATGGALTLTNDTVAWNYLVAYLNRGATGGQGGGVYNAASNTLHLANTIIALDQLFTNSQSGEQSGSANDLPNDLYDTAATSDHDLIGDDTGSTLTNGTNGDQVGTDAAPLNPNFAPSQTNNSFLSFTMSGQAPANYGGLTYTLPLAANSPALNAGDASTAAGSPVAAIAAAEGVSTADATDQRGMARVINGQIDIGATQSGLLLSGSATPSSVQAGQDITYTLTVSNNGPSSLSNVTLSDATPANTTFVSLAAPSGWTTSTPSAGGTGTATANIATLAADTTATFTLIVQVNASTTGGTVITDNASVTYTGSANPVSSSLTLTATVAGQPTEDITQEVGLYETPIFRDPFGGPGTYIQAALFINESGAAISGPIALVLNGLPAGVTVTNANGTYNGSPYVNIEPPNGTWQPGVRYFLVAVLTFSDPTHVKITYTPEVVQGI